MIWRNKGPQRKEQGERWGERGGGVEREFGIYMLDYGR